MALKYTLYCHDGDTDGEMGATISEFFSFWKMRHSLFIFTSF